MTRQPDEFARLASTPSGRSPGQPREGRGRSSPSSTSCSSATGSRCCSTTARSSRTALLANALAGDLPADGVVTGVGRIDGRPVCVMANDPTVKAGSWGARTVEKIVRLTEHALQHELPVVYLVDSAGARITDQVELFPGRRGAGRIFANQVRLSGKVPQVCCLFGPSAAGGAYIPAFCDVVFMVEGNASMYLGSPRMAEVVIGEQVVARGDGRRADARDGQRLRRQPRAPPTRTRSTRARRFLSYLPTSWREPPPPVAARRAGRRRASRSRTIVPAEERRAYDMHKVIDALVDEGSFFELKPLWAKELLIGFARLDGDVVGIVANNPMHLGGVLFVDSRRQGGAVHLAVRRVQRAAAVPRRRARLHDRLAGRAAGDHPPRGEDDHRGGRGDGARSSR